MLLSDATTELRYAKDWSRQTTQWYERRLRPFLAWCQAQGVTELERLTPPLVRRYIAYLQQRPAKRGQRLDSYTVHGHVAAIRTLLFWAASEDLLDESLPRKIRPPRREQKVLPVLSARQIELLLNASKLTPTPLRDVALLSLLLDGGCRAGELCGLKLQDVHFEAEGAWLLVHGKGRKQRPVALGKKARLALYRYLHRERASTERASTSEYVFLGKRGALTPEGLDRLLYRLRDRAGAQHFVGVSVAAHRWRHTHAVLALSAGMNLHALSKQMGHSDIGVTTGYLKALSDEQLRRLTLSPLDTLK